MLSEKEIKEFKEDGFTDEEIEMISDAFALKQTIDMIPEDIESFAKEYEQKVTASENQGMAGFFELAKKDPEFFQKMIALDIALAEETEKQENECPNKKEDCKKEGKGKCRFRYMLPTCRRSVQCKARSFLGICYSKSSRCRC